jgi:hypothetical protein
MALRWIWRNSVHVARRRDCEQTNCSLRAIWLLKRPDESFSAEARTGKVEFQPRVSAASPGRQVVDG